MEGKRKYQVRINGEIIYQYDEKNNHTDSIINTIYNTLICIGCKYSKKWIKEQQGDYIRDILEITCLTF